MNTTSELLRSANLIDHLVRLSGLRKRDDLLSGITQALLETIAAPKVEIFGLVHDENRQFWLPLTEALTGEKVRFVTDPMRGDPDMLVPVDSDPDRHQCLNRMEVVVTAPSASEPLYVTHFPMTVAEGATLWGVAEISSVQPLAPSDCQDATRLVTMYGNILDMLDYSERDALTGLWNRKPFDDLFYKTLKPTEPQQADQPPDRGTPNRKHAVQLLAGHGRHRPLQDG